MRGCVRCLDVLQGDVLGVSAPFRLVARLLLGELLEDLPGVYKGVQGVCKGCAGVCKEGARRCKGVQGGVRVQTCITPRIIGSMTEGVWCAPE